MSENLDGIRALWDGKARHQRGRAAIARATAGEVLRTAALHPRRFNLRDDPHTFFTLHRDS